MITRAALLGYGRFGSALGSLLRSADIGFAAFDPKAEVPADLRRDSLAELVADAETVFLAVPMPEIEPVLRSLRPHLRPQHLVLDVASVKVRPQQLMSRWLGREVPWVATHPLFGPTSLALGERPLRVIVCPNLEHPDAAARVQQLYQTLDCEVTLQAAEAHDRIMARTHALAFFVAKGLLDIGVDELIQQSPPSFRALARTIEAVRSDAGHLFAGIHLENPFAAEARQALLERLASTDRQLREGVEPTAIEPAHPQASMAEISTPEGLQLVRRRIDEIDGELFSLLTRRAQLARAAGQAKEAAGQPVRDAQREAELLAARRRWAEQAQLDPMDVTAIYESILRFARHAQGEHDGAVAEQRGG